MLVYAFCVELIGHVFVLAHLDGFLRVVFLGLLGKFTDLFFDGLLDCLLGAFLRGLVAQHDCKQQYETHVLKMTVFGILAS